MLLTSQYTKIITLQNIDDEDFIFNYNSSEGNPPYIIRAGEAVRYPEFLAKHALKHLIDKIMNKRDEKTSNQQIRLEIANEIIIGEEDITQEKQLTEAERLKMEVDELNKPSTLDTILAKRKAEKEHTEEVEKVEKEGVEKAEEFEGLPEVKKRMEKAEKKPKEVAALPTRAELYDYAKKKMNMVLDEKTTKKLAKMNVEKLIEELQYPLK